MKILIDNGHGENTPGKRSPDGSLREYAYAREIADRIAHELSARGYDAERIVRETVDVPLSERARRVNEVCGRYGTANVVLVSRGWSAYTSKGKTKADKLATFLYEEAEKNFISQRIRKDNSDDDPDWEENFYILSKTKCPAVLTENFFQDNKDDVLYLCSEEGKQAIVKTHVEAITRYIQKYGNIVCGIIFHITVF